MREFAVAMVAALFLAPGVTGQEPKPIYQNDFSQAELGQVPNDLLVLDGAYSVQAEGGNKFLELPGAPLDSFGVLFGPSAKGDLTVSLRVFATAQGRRFPTFAVGLNGLSGYRLQVSPAKRLLELYQGESVRTTAPYQWEPNRWTHLLLHVSPDGSGWKVEGKVWPDGEPKPARWSISWPEKGDLPAGRASLFGSPFSGKPIRFDDLVISRAP